MPRVLPAEDQFEVLENKVVHTPTGATWEAYPGRKGHSHYRAAQLGSVLDNGDDFREDQVTELALKLLAGRLAKK
jgi:hypothetical protein